MNPNRNFFRNVSTSMCRLSKNPERVLTNSRGECRRAKPATTHTLATALVLLATVASPGCDNDSASQPEETGQAMLSLANIPDNVNCIRVTAAGEFRSSVSDFDVVPGDTLSQALTGLPVGAVVFSANAYSGACTSVTKSTVPMWISDEKTVNIVQGRSSSVTLTLYKNGRAKVTVEFADQEDGGTDSGSSTGSVDGGAPTGG
jgi:hypothetical protein